MSFAKSFIENMSRNQALEAPEPESDTDVSSLGIDLERKAGQISRATEVEGVAYMDKTYDYSVPNSDVTTAYQAYHWRPHGITEYERRDSCYIIYSGEVYCRVGIGYDKNGKVLLCHTTVSYVARQLLKV